MTVNAGDDDEYLELEDIWTIQAYSYWQKYGLTADSSYTYTDSYSSSGGISFGATFTMQAAIQETAQADTFGTFQMEYEEAGHNYSVWIPKSVDLSITPDSGQTGAQTVPSFACTYDAASTSHSATMNCTPSGNSVFTQDDYTMTINTLGDAGDGTGGLFCYIRQSSTNPAVGSITATEESPIISHFILQGTEMGTGNLSGTGTVSLTTTTVNTNNLKFAYPIMIGSIKQSMNWTSGDTRQLFNRPNNPATVIFLTIDNWGMTGSSMCDLYRYGNNQKVSKVIVNNMNRTGSGYELRCISLYSNDIGDADKNWTANNSFIVKWNYTQTAHIIPIFVGYASDIPDDLYRYIYHGDRNIDAINAQTAADQQHHDEMMDTSDSSHIATDGDALVNDADEKFGDLFFPLQHAIETANDLSNVQSTGTIRLPAIFADGEYWVLDLTQIEQNIPQAFSFIRSLCQLAVAIFMIKGLYNLFFGNNGGDVDDS